MFEIFKAYRNIYKFNKYLKGCKKVAELTGDEESVRVANDALYLNEFLKKIMWRNRKIAENYNLQLKNKGLV